jgi:hypothetical protein
MVTYAAAPFAAPSAPDPADDLPRHVGHCLLDLGWEALRQERLGVSDQPVEAGLILAHRSFGLALLDLAHGEAEHPTTDRVAEIRARLEAAGFQDRFPGWLPIIHRTLSLEDLWRLPLVLDHAFAREAALSLGDRAWIPSVQQALLDTPVAGDPVAADPVAADPVGAVPVVTGPLVQGSALDVHPAAQAGLAPPMAAPTIEAARQAASPMPASGVARRRPGLPTLLRSFGIVLLLFGAAVGLRQYLAQADSLVAEGPVAAGSAPGRDRGYGATETGSAVEPASAGGREGGAAGSTPVVVPTGEAEAPPAAAAPSTPSPRPEQEAVTSPGPRDRDGAEPDSLAVTQAPEAAGGASGPAIVPRDLPAAEPPTTAVAEPAAIAPAQPPVPAAEPPSVPAAQPSPVAAAEASNPAAEPPSLPVAEPSRVVAAEPSTTAVERSPTPAADRPSAPVAEPPSSSAVLPSPPPRGGTVLDVHRAAVPRPPRRSRPRRPRRCRRPRPRRSPRSAPPWSRRWSRAATECWSRATSPAPGCCSAAPPTPAARRRPPPWHAASKPRSCQASVPAGCGRTPSRPPSGTAAQPNSDPPADWSMR